MLCRHNFNLGRMLLEAAACKSTLQMKPSARPLPASLSPRLLKRSSLPSSRLLCLPLSGAASLPAVLERLLPATPAVGPLSSDSSVSTLRRLCSALRLLRPCLSAFGARQSRATPSRNRKWWSSPLPIFIS